MGGQMGLNASRSRQRSSELLHGDDVGRARLAIEQRHLPKKSPALSMLR